MPHRSTALPEILAPAADIPDTNDHAGDTRSGHHKDGRCTSAKGMAARDDGIHGDQQAASNQEAV